MPERAGAANGHLHRQCQYPFCNCFVSTQRYRKQVGEIEHILRMQALFTASIDAIMST
jgi:hypothetical protein